MEVSNGDDASYSNGREPRNAASPPASSPTNGALVAPKTEPIYKIYLGNLAQSTTEADLREVFERYGRILNIELRTGFGFVEFSSPSECEAALQGENGKEWLGNVIKVEHAQSRTSKVAMTSSSACYKCGLDGHWARECPNVPTKSRPRRPLSPQRSISPRARAYSALSPPPGPYDYPDARSRPAYDDREKYYAPPPRDYRDYREPPRRSRYPEPPPVSARDYREPPFYSDDRYGDRYGRDYPPAPVAAAPRYEREYLREPPPPSVPRTLREPMRDYRERDPRDDYRERDYYYRRPPQAIPAAAHAPAPGPPLASDRYRYSERRSPPVQHPSYDRQAPPPDRYADRDRRYADYPPPGPPPPGRYRSASPPPPPSQPRRGASGPLVPRSPSAEYRGRPYR